MCQRIADLFDHLVYRPDWIVDWEGGGHWARRLSHGNRYCGAALVALTEQQASHLHPCEPVFEFIGARCRPANRQPVCRSDCLFWYLFVAAALSAGAGCAGRAFSDDVHLLLTNPCHVITGVIAGRKPAEPRMLDPSCWRSAGRTGENHRADSPLLPETDWQRLFSQEGEQQGNPLLVSMGKQGGITWR